MPTCPICNTETATKVISPLDNKESFYYSCPNCSVFFQSPMVSKKYEASHETDEDGNSRGHLMSDREKQINRSLAQHIFTNFMGSKPGNCADLGAKYSYLAYSLQQLGCKVFATDCIDPVEEYSKELNVPMLKSDFELDPENILQEWSGVEKFDLITLIHLFEHFQNPKLALKKLRNLVSDNGIVFLRLPTHDVSGWEKDMAPSFEEIHYYFHSLSSILELLVQGQDLFTVSWYSQMEGAGQTDIVLKPINKKPTIWCGMIVKNEERDLPICLNSIQDTVDGIVIIDTGSVDNTEQVAKSVWSKPIIYETYTGASRRNIDGDWKLFDFSAARNQFINKIDSMDVDYIVWYDADDTLLSPNQIKRAVYLNQFDVFGIWMDSGNKWVHHRLWKNHLGINFAGRVHEYPVLGNRPCKILDDVFIHHDAAPGIGETSNARNLRILLEELKEKPNDSRTLFYIANTYKDNSQWLEATKYYKERIKQVVYWDEWIFSYLYCGRCLRAAGMLVEAEQILLEGLSHAPNWAELSCELAYLAYQRGDKLGCISYCMYSASRTISPTQLWRETDKYTDQPRRLLSHCYNELGSKQLALDWALEAKKHIHVEDTSWDQHTEAIRRSL